MLVGISLVLASDGGCLWSGGGRVVSLRQLESAPLTLPGQTRRIVLADAQALDGAYHALTPRLGILVVRDAATWQRLARQMPNPGPQPDLSTGAVVGVVSRAGLPLDGCWPVSLDAIQVHGGAGLVSASFRGGTYLPDGTLYAETAYVNDLDAVLVVSVNGLRYFPE